MSALVLPQDYPRLRVVAGFAELSSASFEDGVHALCWQRELSGDFGEIVRHFAGNEGITSIDVDQLIGLALSPTGRVAAAVLVEDLRCLQALGLQPELNVINGYRREEKPGPVPRDVMSWHADSATEETDTWLCTYYGASSEALRHEDALCCSLEPEIRAALLAVYGGGDDAGFAEFLSEECYDLHYSARPEATPYVFGQGNLWRVATIYPGCPVPPCVHRAPAASRGELRLLVIS